MKRTTTNSGENINITGSDNDRIMFNSVFRAVKILGCLSDGISSLTEIADCCGLCNSTTHRLLKTLEKTGMAAYDPTRHRYHLGPMLCRLSSKPQTAHQLLITCAIDEMERLSEISGETISLDIVMGIETVLLHHIPSQHALQITYELKSNDRLLPIGATGKVLLSQFNDEELDIVINNLTWSSIVENVGINREILIAEIKRIRKQGYAISHGERIVGALALAAPISNYTHAAALTVAGYDHRLLPKVSPIVEELKKSVSRVSEHVVNILKMITPDH